MIDAATEKLDLLKRDFQTILEKALKFVKNDNEKLKSLDTEFELEENLPSKGKKPRKLSFEDNFKNQSIY